jgi:hypothetical protein
MTRELSSVCDLQGSGLRENGGEWSRVGFMRASVSVNTVDCVDAAVFGPSPEWTPSVRKSIQQWYAQFQRDGGLCIAISPEPLDP